jgi:hypothetical protein
MASLNVAETRVLTGTVMAPLAGAVEMTVGGTTVAAVVKLQTTLAARPTPGGSFAALVIVAVSNVLLARTTDGVNVAVLPP